MTSTSQHGLARPLRHLDYGFFGPTSPSWKVWSSPTALIGFQRSVVLEHFDPFLTAAVADMNGIYADPRGRLDRTLAYFLAVATGDGRTAIELSEMLMKVHAKATGIEPITGKRYNANNPESQLWIHVTGWHSVLKAYEMYGPGPLTAAEEKQYWADCVTAAELQTCDPADVPRSREEVREYFAKVRPTLCTSERALRAMHYLLRTSADSNGGWPFWFASRVIAPATIASLPKWMRTTGTFDQPRLLDIVVPPAMRVLTTVTKLPFVADLVLGAFAPMTGAIRREHLDSPAPLREEVVSPAEARAAYGRSGTRAAVSRNHLVSTSPAR